MNEKLFEELFPLLGLPVDSPEVAALREKYPDHRITKPSDGDQYVIFQSLGFDLLFRANQGSQGNKTKRQRLLRCIFLYCEGKDRHKAFAVPPYGINFSDHRETLWAKLGEPIAASDKDERGLPGWEKWHVGEITIHTMYERTGMTSQVFTIGSA